MGKTPTPIRALVTRKEMLEWPRIKEFAAQGHVFEYLPGTEGADVLLGPECHLMNDELADYVELAVRAVQRRKKGREK